MEKGPNNTNSDSEGGFKVEPWGPDLDAETPAEHKPGVESWTAPLGRAALAETLSPAEPETETSEAKESLPKKGHLLDIESVREGQKDTADDEVASKYYEYRREEDNRRYDDMPSLFEEEYPEEYKKMQEMIDRSAEEYGDGVRRFFDRWGQFSFYGNGPYIHEWFKDKEHIEALQSLVDVVAMDTGVTGVEPELFFDRTPQEIKELPEKLRKIFMVVGEDPDDGKRWAVVNTARDAFSHNYVSGVFDDAFVDRVIKYVETDIERAHEGKETSDIATAIRMVALEQDTASFEPFLDYERELLDSPDNVIAGGDEEWSYKFLRSTVLSEYAAAYGLDEKRVQGFRESVFPMVEQKDPEVACLQDYIGGFSMGLRNFTVHALVSEVKPGNVNELMHMYRSIPTSDFNRYWQNREDALTLAYVIYGGRDFIHDECPGVHELLERMAAFYDSRGSEAEHARSTAKLQEIVAARKNGEGGGNPMYYDKLELCLDLKNYEKKTERTGEAAIDVLHRLVENTRQDRLTPPETENAELNEAMRGVEIFANDRTGETKVELPEVGKLAEAMNKYLVSEQGTVGMRPSMVEAVAFTERMATLAVRGLKGKDWQEAVFDPNFKEIVRLNDLINRQEAYDERGFEEFYADVRRELSAGGADGEPNYTDTDKVREAYGKIGTRTLGGLNVLARRYMKKPFERQFVGALWSGNLAGELIKLGERPVAGEARTV